MASRNDHYNCLDTYRTYVQSSHQNKILRKIWFCAKKVTTLPHLTVSTNMEGLRKTEALLFEDELDPYKISRLRIRIRIRKIHIFLGLKAPDPLVRDTDPDPS
jgi:hypothetical protein